MNRYRLIIFDRDGTLTYEDHDYHRDLTKVRAYPFVPQALKRLSSAGVQLAVATNQSGIGRGYWSRDQVDELHAALTTGWSVDMAWHICPHLPDDGCDCRKPEPGLMTQAIKGRDLQHNEVLMVGDSLTDAIAAQTAGIDFALVLTGRGRDTVADLTGQVAVLNTVAEVGQAYG